jgi:hypothetical protein
MLKTDHFGVKTSPTKSRFVGLPSIVVYWYAGSNKRLRGYIATMSCDIKQSCVALATISRTLWPLSLPNVTHLVGIVCKSALSNCSTSKYYRARLTEDKRRRKINKAKARNPTTQTYENHI